MPTRASVLPAAMPQLCFHGTSQEFSQARPLTHFGSRQAALQAPRYRGVLLAFEISIRNPLEVPDIPGGADMFGWLYDATERDLISPAEFAAWEAKPLEMDGVGLLQRHGYDGLCYTNAHEDPGSLSWVIFEPSQAVRVPCPEDAAAIHWRPGPR